MEAKSAQSKQLFIFAGAAGLILAAVIYAVYSITHAKQVDTKEQSVINGVSTKETTVTNPTRDISQATPKQKELINQYNQDQALKAQNTQIGGAMSLFTPETVQVEPDKKEDIEAQRIREDAEKARSRVVYEQSSKQRKTYSAEQYQTVFDSYQGLRTSFEAQNSTDIAKAANPVVVTGEQISAFDKLNGSNNPDPATRNPGQLGSDSSGFSGGQQGAPAFQSPVGAGDLAYGYFLNKVDTASGGDVIVKITSPGLKDLRLIGKPTLVNKKVMIPLTVGYLNGQKFSVKAAVVKPEDVSTLVEGNYDGHYWARLGLPGLASLVTGTMGAAADILKNEGTTITTGTNTTPLQSTPRTSSSEALKKGVYAGASGASKVFADELQKEGQMNIPNATIEANTTTAILFFAPIELSQGPQGIGTNQTGYAGGANVFKPGLGSNQSSLSGIPENLYRQTVQK